MICKYLKELESGFAGMTESGIFGLFTMASTVNPGSYAFLLPFLPACALHADRHEFHD
jgi:hypothetical protein